MKTGKHQKIAGALQIVQSFPPLLMSSYYFTELIAALRSGSPEFELHEAIVMSLIIVLIFLIGTVLVWFGYSLIREKPWTSRIGGFICCVPGLIAFPYVISAYTLWVVLQVNKENKHEIIC